MIVFSCCEETETKQAWEGAPLRSWRWALTLERWSVVWQRQGKYPGKDWFESRRFSIGFRKTFRFRFLPEHFYYDGTNCCLNWGWFHAFWQPQHCKVCCAGMDAACSIDTEES